MTIVTGNLSWIPVSEIYWVSGTLFTILTVLIGYMVRKTFGDMKNEWYAAKDKLTTIEKTSRVQAENHLNTLQTESLKHTALLEDMVKEQSETNGKIGTLVVILAKRTL